MSAFAPPSASSRLWQRAALLALGWKLTLLLIILLLDACFNDYDASALLPVPPLHTTTPNGSPGREPKQCPGGLGFSDAAAGRCRLGPGGMAEKGAEPPAFLKSLMVWDSVFMVDIAVHGYQYEHYYAFFPLLPVLAGALGTRLFPVLALALTTASFTVMVALFSQLCVHELEDIPTSALATLFLIFNPATIFHTMAYTEAIFTCLTILGLYLLRCKGAMWPAAIAFALASCCRSNGVINMGFILHEGLQRAVASIASSNQARGQAARWPRAALHLLTAALAAMLVTVPLVAIQIHGYLHFCPGAAASWRQLSAPQDFEMQPDSTVPVLSQAVTQIRCILAHILGPPVSLETASGHGGQLAPRPWCEWSLPRVYNFIQEEYWGVGLFRYFQLKQLPNFALASPVLILAFSACITYIKGNVVHMLLGGLVLKEEKGTSKPPPGFMGPKVAVYIYPTLFMALTATLVMHVQVATRFLSSCPPLYWYMAHICGQGSCNHSGSSQTRSSDSSSSHAEHSQVSGSTSKATVSQGHRAALLCWGWSWSYIAVGTVLFVNFYPWT